MGNLNARAFALISKKILRKSIDFFFVISLSKIYEILIIFGSKKIDLFEGEYNQQRRSEQNIVTE